MKAVITKEEYDALGDERLTKEYKLREGTVDKYQLIVEPAEGLMLAPTAELQNALQGERTKNKSLETKLKAFGDLDPAAAREAIEKVATMDGWDPDQKLAEHKAKFEKQVQDQADARIKSVTEKLTKELETKDNSLKTVSEQLDDTMRRNQSISAISAAGGSVKLLLPIMMSKSRVIPGEDGKRVLEVLDDKGVARLSPMSGKNENMTLDELVVEMKNDKEFAACFRANGASGTGAVGDTTKTGTKGAQSKGNPFLQTSWNLTEQGRLLKEDPSAHRTLLSEATAKEPQGRAARMAVTSHATAGVT